MDIFQILVDHRQEFAIGLLMTVKLCALIWPIGLILGALLGMAGVRWKNAVGLPSRAVSFILGGIPVLVFLFWLHYPLQSVLRVVIDPFYTAVAALAILNTVLVADMVRGVLVEFPEQYVLAARACGLSHRETVIKIQLPIVLRQILPPLLFLQVTMLQATLFASLISVDEIFRIVQRVNSEIYRPVELYTALAVLFLVVCLPLHGLALWLKVRFTRNLSEQ
jgi:polar amino acid transport system permease protein